MINPFCHLAELERAKEIQNFINCSHTTSQATCTLKHLHWSRWIAERDINDFQKVCFKNSLSSEQRTSKVYNLKIFFIFKNTSKSKSLSLRWKNKRQLIYKLFYSWSQSAYILILLHSFAAFVPTWLPSINEGNLVFTQCKNYLNSDLLSPWILLAPYA